MRTLALRSLNPTRASLLVTEYLGQVWVMRDGRGERGDVILLGRGVGVLASLVRVGFGTDDDGLCPALASSEV